MSADNLRFGAVVSMGGRSEAFARRRRWDASPAPNLRTRTLHFFKKSFDIFKKVLTFKKKCVIIVNEK